jgi:NitT/TauT family transport system permease protein
MKRRRRSDDGSTLKVWLWRVAIVATLFCAWQFLPQIQALSDFSPIFDPFFVSSPVKVAERVWDLLFGLNGQPSVWPFFVDTALSTLIGVAISIVAGALLGLLLSNNRTTERVISPFVALVNATPRVALVPLFIIIAGPTMTTSVLTVVAVVTFIVFYNAYAGGVSVPAEVINSARLLGARPREVMRRIRLPYVLVWTFTSLPNAISFGLVAAVTAEILMGRLGMGRLLAQSLSTVDSTLTFAVIVILAVFGVILVSAAQFVERRILHWWQP